MEYIFIAIHFIGTILLAYKIIQLSDLVYRLQRRESTLEAYIDRLINRLSNLEAREASLEKNEYNYEVSTNKELRELRNDIKSINNVVNKIKI